MFLPGSYDPLSAKLVEEAGFDVAYIGSSTIAATDCLDEFVHAATAVTIPLIADAERGFFEPPNSWRRIGTTRGGRMAATESHDQVAGQVLVVTGGAGVIGRAICEAFGRGGALVAVADLVDRPCDETVAAIEQNGGRAVAVPVDVTDRASVDAMVARVERELGPIDLLINNAGHLGPIGPIWEVDPDSWWRAWEVNVRGLMLCARGTLIGMVDAAVEESLTYRAARRSDRSQRSLLTRPLRRPWLG